MTSSEAMPVLFVGHGSPMNAIEENAFTQGWRDTIATVPRPVAILCISAHWETDGASVTGTERPRTIHDFYGFPPALYQIQYPAAGHLPLAKEVVGYLETAQAELDTSWGLDHGCWSVLRVLYPEADLPVLQLSLHRGKPPQWHFEMARRLVPLRRQGVLVLGSGNIVHNLSLMDWRTSGGYGWANVANARFKELIGNGDTGRLCEYTSLGREVGLAVPTPEHFLPLLYVLALKDDDDDLSFFNDQLVFGSVSMVSLVIGDAHQRT